MVPSNLFPATVVQNKLFSGTLGFGFNFIRLSIIPSSIGYNYASDAKDTIQQINHSHGSADTHLLEKKIKTIESIQNVTLGYDIATLFVLPAPVTIPTSIILNAINWHKTGQLKRILKHTLSEDIAE